MLKFEEQLLILNLKKNQIFVSFEKDFWLGVKKEH
jgi:hypothetical protein